MDQVLELEKEIKLLKEQNLKLFYLHRKNIESPKLIQTINADFCFKIEKKSLQVQYNDWMENIKLA